MAENPQPAVISEIRGVFFFERKRNEECFLASSPPGHLLHLVIDGEVRQRCNDREYRLSAGDLLWYHNNEFVEGRCVQTPWRFYSVVFEAPHIPPPDFQSRLSHPPKKVAALFRELHAAWTDTGEDPVRRSLRCHSALTQILLLHQALPTAPRSALDNGWLIRLWWNVEHQVRQNLGHAFTLDELADLGKVSPATLYRASMAAVGTPPVRHVKMLRLDMARSLLTYSRLSITEVAENSGYERLNEFSRDIRVAFGEPPSALRKKAILWRKGT